MAGGPHATYRVGDLVTGAADGFLDDGDAVGDVGFALGSTVGDTLNIQHTLAGGPEQLLLARGTNGTPGRQPALPTGPEQ